MERHRGHFYNWYDTRTLAPLPPRYVSTVDSGNLAASLIALRQGLLEQLKRPVIDACVVDAIRDHGGAAPGKTPSTLAEWRAWLNELAPTVPLARTWREELDALAPGEESDSVPVLSEVAPPTLLDRLRQCADLAHELLREMEFGFLLHRKRKLLHIGYNVDTERLDVSRYDLLASEARIASFVAIAKSDIPQENWLRLGRALVLAEKQPALLSWSGTMFEYLMPLLWMKSFPGSLLDRGIRGAVKCQRRFAKRRGVPWGVSECACSERIEGDFRYHAFGIPDLALRPVTETSLVIAPYASVLALMTQPCEAAANLQAQAARGWLGALGFHEAADFGDSGTREKMVPVYMAHHQGMSLVALDNVLNGDRMRERFHREPMVQATELLLHERVGRAVPVEKPEPPMQEAAEVLTEKASAA